MNAGRPLLLEGGLSWQPLSLSPKDMDFLEAKNAAARDIALAFGVPPMLLGIPGDNTYSNLAEANRAFWRTSVVPLVTRTAEVALGLASPGLRRCAAHRRRSRRGAGARLRPRGAVAAHRRRDVSLRRREARGAGLGAAGVGGLGTRGRL